MNTPFNFNLSRKQPQALSVDALILTLAGAALPLQGAAAAVDTALGSTDGLPGAGAISRLIELGDFAGKPNEIAVVYTHGLIPSPRVILAGLGEADGAVAGRLRHAAGAAVRKARDLGCRRVALALGNGLAGLDARAAAQAAVEGGLMGLYRFRELKSGRRDEPDVDELLLVAPAGAGEDELMQGAAAGAAIAGGVNTARTLANRPANLLTPAALAEFAAHLAGQGGLACTLLDERGIAELRMGGVQAVAQGSAHPPRFVILEHPGDGRSDAAPLVFIGKGVTFDSGGISLKDPQGMENMKADMSGAAAVIGALQAVAALKLPQRVIGIAPLVENMPSGQAFRPGDVVTMMSGATVEVVSTDAEGRMILADALHYAKRYAPRGAVDVATLTGACAIALGEGVAAGIFANRNAWARQVLSAARACGERLWRLPLYPEYADKMRSDTADLKNTAGRLGGVGASAYFLKRFVDGEGAYPWAHIDMAGMMFSPETKGCQVKGAQGYGVRTLVELARQEPVRPAAGA